MVNRNEYIMVSLVYKGHQYYKSFGAVFIVIRLSCSLLIRTILSLEDKNKHRWHSACIFKDNKE